MRANSRPNLVRKNCCTIAKYIWARSCGNGESKTNPPFVQSTHKAVRAWKLLLLHHRRIMPAMEIPANSRPTLARKYSCTIANYIWAISCGNGESKKTNPPFVQSTLKAVRACKFFLLHHRRIMPAKEMRANSRPNLVRKNCCTIANYIWARSCGNGESKNANPPFVQSTNKAVRTCKFFILHHRRIMPAMEISANSRPTLARKYSCTIANYIWAISCGNGESKKTNPPFVQSTLKAVRACKFFFLHHLRIMPAKEMRANSRPNLVRKNCCTIANYIWARSCGNGESKNANPPFVQSTHKAVRACKLFFLHHRRIMPAMEIRANSRPTLARNNRCTIANYIWARSCGNRESKSPKLYEPANNPLPATPYIIPSMEIHAISLLHVGRNKGCTNPSSISRRSWRYGEFKNVNPQSVE